MVKSRNKTTLKEKKTCQAQITPKISRSSLDKQNKNNPPLKIILLGFIYSCVTPLKEVALVLRGTWPHPKPFPGWVAILEGATRAHPGPGAGDKSRSTGADPAGTQSTPALPRGGCELPPCGLSQRLQVCKLNCSAHALSLLLSCSLPLLQQSPSVLCAWFLFHPQLLCRCQPGRAVTRPAQCDTSTAPPRCHTAQTDTWADTLHPAELTDTAREGQSRDPPHSSAPQPGAGTAPEQPPHPRTHTGPWAQQNDSHRIIYLGKEPEGRGVQLFPSTASASTNPRPPCPKAFLLHPKESSSPMP